MPVAPAPFRVTVAGTPADGIAVFAALCGQLLGESADQGAGGGLGVGVRNNPMAGASCREQQRSPTWGRRVGCR